MRPRGSRFSNWLPARPVDSAEPRRTAQRRIGLLGGSFNPAHEGHLAISLEALKRLQLHEVWWLVAPQNPLKDTAETAPYDVRIAKARSLTRHPRLHVSDLEKRWHCTFTIDTIEALHLRLPDHNFVWLMGADAFAGLHHWKHWTRIVNAMPVAVINRPGFIHAACASHAAIHYAARRLPPRRAAGLLAVQPPCWTFLDIPLRPESSTAIRSGLGK
jgi:nicotinate-nucleotide adenylyltransferase